MRQYSEEEARQLEELNRYLIVDEETAEIIGLDPSAPDSVKAAYEEMQRQMNSLIPEDKD